jgi:hypothetical protein
MEQSLSWETNSLLAKQEITRLLWNPKFHYPDHKGSQLVSVQNKMNQSTPPTVFLTI